MCIVSWVGLPSYVGRFPIQNDQDVERPNILSAHTLCIYLFASELKQLTSLCNNQNKVFATFMCTQLTGDSPACPKLSGREKDRKAPAANIATRDSNPKLGICRDRRDRWSCKSFVSCVNFSRKQRSFLHILQVYTHLNVNFLTHFVQF